ncbi:protein artichoke-like isoform X1 [Centruroides sculpturatus]|uniref:protein artichoke-like isoform X1 n=2 Tax=Centruroides sculpturatus TaxID=218467 RepID=UPI000C6ED4D2|nr:protein artichoke-like isoform X1 [Centruroides sculpturatus]
MSLTSTEMKGILDVSLFKWMLLICFFALTSCRKQCGDIFGRLMNLPCFCDQDLRNGTIVDCDRVSFAGNFPVLPHRYRIHGYRQRHAGIQTLETLLFTASAIPLETVDFSHNLLRRLTERMFDGVQNTLEEIYLGHNKLGDQLNPIFSTSELRQLRNLKILDLSSNQLRSIDSRVFEGLISLEILNLELNDLSVVPTESLKDLISLKSLLLQENDLIELSRSSFPKLQSLTTLNLTGNQISSLQDGTFFNLTYLKVLLLRKNKLRRITEDVFTGLRAIEVLDLSNNFFHTVPLNSLEKIPTLKELYLHSNKIKSLDGISLTALKDLEILNLSRNRIFIFPSNFFTGVSKLKSLIIDLNNIYNPNNKTFRGLENLNELSMQHNSFLNFPSLTTFTNLRKLNVNYNRIKALPKNILMSVNQLDELSLSYNLITEIPDGTFQNFINLRVLNLRGNNLPQLSSDKLRISSSTLEHLDLGNNDISRVTRLDFPRMVSLNLDNNKLSTLSPDSFDQMTNLKHLNLSRNRLERLFPDSFIKIHGLLNLDLSHNLLTYIPSQAFLNLTVFRLNNNRLKELRESYFKNMHSLKFLYLGYNGLTEIEKATFDTLPALKYLDLSNNELTSFRAEIFNKVDNLEELNLSNNYITYLYPNSFRVHPQLKSVNLDSNRLSFLPTEILSSLNNLEHVILSRNLLKSLQAFDFSNLPNLRTVELQENEISKIDEKAFQNSSQLHWIYLRDNFITSLSPATFKGIYRLNLDLSGNNLNSLPNDLFNRQSVFKLESINLARNDFREFPTTALKKQYSYLEKANISLNKISNLPSNSDVLVNVKQLDLSDNPLSNEAYQVIFGEPKSVRKLYVRNVGIKSLPTIESPFLKELDLSGNELKSIEDVIFQKASSLTSLNLSGNKIPNIRVHLNNVWLKLPRLSELILSSNPLVYISRSDFSNLKNLKVLRLDNLTEITQFDCEGLRGLTKLRELWLFGYPLLHNIDIKYCLADIIGVERLKVEIKDPQLQDQLHSIFSPRLKELAITGKELMSLSSSSLAGINSPEITISLPDNGIASLSSNVFRPLPLMSKIIFDLSKSQLRTITPDILTAILNKQVDITMLGIENNPISCDCHLVPLWKYLREKTLPYKFLCFSPPHLRSRRVKSLKENDLVCTEDSTTVLPSTKSQKPIIQTTLSYEVLYEQTTSRRPAMSVPPSAINKTTLTKVDTMIIGIIAGVVAFVCILIIIICIIRLRRARPHYTAGPLAGPLALRAQGKCTCLKPPPTTCTCYPPFPLAITYPRMNQQTLPAPTKLLPLPAPPIGSGRQRPRKSPSYYVTYPESDNENR